MSYEGYVQFLCKDGHGWVEDALNLSYNMIDESTLKCPDCGLLPFWRNSVDETNGCEAYDPKTSLPVEILPDHSNCQCGRVDLEIREELWCICQSCDNRHLSKPIQYKIPEGKGVILKI